MNTCSHCGAPVSISSAAFCARCGKPLERAQAPKKTPFVPYSCPSCGAPVELGDSHCPYCKMPLYNDTDAPMTGTCAMCGKPAPAGSSYCLDCREILHDMKHDDEEDGNAQTHPCAGCGKIVWVGVEYCPDCKEKQRRAEAEAKKARRVCWHCGSETQTRNRYCASCRQARRFFPNHAFSGLFSSRKFWNVTVSVTVWLLTVCLIAHFFVKEYRNAPILKAQNTQYQQMTAAIGNLTFEYPKKFEATFTNRSYLDGQTAVPSIAYTFDAIYATMNVIVTGVQPSQADISTLYANARQACSSTPKTSEIGADWYELYWISPSGEIYSYEYGKLIDGWYYQLQFEYDKYFQSSFSGYWAQFKDRFHPYPDGQVPKNVVSPVIVPEFEPEHVTAPSYNKNYISFSYPRHFYFIVNQPDERTTFNPYYYTALAGTSDGSAQLRIVVRDRTYSGAQAALETAPHTAEFAGAACTVTVKDMAADRYYLCCDADGQDLSLFEKCIITDKYEYILEFIYPTSQKYAYQDYIDQMHETFSIFGT